MARLRQWLASASVLGIFLVGAPQCAPEDLGQSRRLNAADPIPVGATDPDGDPSQPRPTRRSSYSFKAR